MAPVLPNSTSIPLTPGIAFITRKNNSLSRCSVHRNPNNQLLPAQKYILPLSTSLRLFPQFRIRCSLQPNLRTHVASATGTDVAVEEADLSAAENEASVTATDAAEIAGELSAKSNPAPTQSKRPRPVRKSELPPVRNEELIPGATFTGKVRSIQPFGAFIDFGAFTDGLVHVSRLSDSFVKDVASIVTVGQEVTVRLIEANMETGRISLSMRESDDSSRQQPQKDAQLGRDDTRPPRKTGQKSNQKKEEVKKRSKFVKGQDLEGTVKNLTRAGAFISLPEGEEGFLPTSEEADEGFGSLMGGGSSLEVGQEVNVRVLRISRGQVTLTMKKEEEAEELDSKLSQGVIHKATNPFVLAFRSNKVISEFLDERKNEDESVENAEQDAMDTVGASIMVDTSIEALDEEKEQETVPDNSQRNDIGTKSLKEVEASYLEQDAVDTVGASIMDDTSIEALDEEKEQETIPDNSQKDDSGTKNLKEVEASSIVHGDGIPLTEDQITEELSPTETKQSKEDVEISGKVADPILTSEIVEESVEKAADNAIVKDEELSQKPDTAVPSATEGESELSGEITNQSLLSDIIEEVTEKTTDDVIAKDEDSSEKPENTISYAAQGEEETAAPNPEENVIAGTTSIAKDEYSSEKPENTIPYTAQGEEETAAPNPEENVIAETTSIAKDEDSSEKPENTIPYAAQGDEETTAPNPVENAIAETTSTASQVAGNLGDDKAVNVVQFQTSADKEKETEPDLQQNGNVSNPSGQSDASASETPTKAAISPALVKQLREETGAGMMDCKKALSETEGDIVKAQEYLRKKGLASADKKASRTTAEGRIGSYIHDSRIGVLIEVNCETDFVARGDIFKGLVEDLAMQVAACPYVQYLNSEDVPKEIVDKEREIEMQKEDLLSKPELIRSKIVDGRIRKRLEDLALLEQPFIKDDKVVVKDWVKQTISTIGENIKVKRFVRYNLGEGLEKKSQDFAAEVAAQTVAKPVSTSVKQEPAVAAAETKETTEKPPKAMVSAALVKQLREETGAGMMDCKKALSETGGDLQKAQEYLRKKGLSTADKKSSRLAAEGKIGSYIHDARIGVLIEVNCETDFVGRGQNFKELVDDLAMQVVASPQVQYVSVEDIPESIVNEEKQIEMQREDLQSKPENIREKIVEGRVSKRLGELALLEQPFIKNDSLLVKDLIKQTVAALGENIKIRRFVRFTLGETSNEKVENEA